MHPATFAVAVMMLTLQAIGADAPPAGRKLPVPGVPAIKAAAALVDETFGRDIAAAKTPDQKKAIVQQLLHAAGDENGPSRYVLLSRAKSLAIAAGDIADCNAALDALEAMYEMDYARERFESYVKIADTLRAHADRVELCCDVSALIQTDVTAERFDLVKSAIDLEQLLTRQDGDAGLLAQFNADAQKVHTAQTAYSQLKKPFATLSLNPDDIDANLKVGKFRCFVIENWAAGLKNLSLSSDTALRLAAQAEIANPSTADDRLKLADAWWDISTALPGTSKVNVQMHAAGWYETASSGLNGLQKTKAIKRAAEARAQATPNVDQIAAGKKRAIGRWFQPSINLAFVLSADGTATAGNLTGRWTVNFAGTDVQIRWDQHNWVDDFKLKDGKWIKCSVQDGAQLPAVEILPP